MCPNECVLFRGDAFSELENSLWCGAARRRRCGKSMVLLPVLRFCPFIPQHVRMYQNPILAVAMSFAATHKGGDTKMRSIVDSVVWWIAEGGVPGLVDDPVRWHGVKGLSMLFPLHYCEVRTQNSLYCHNILIVCFFGLQKCVLYAAFLWDSLACFCYRYYIIMYDWIAWKITMHCSHSLFANLCHLL